MAKEKTKPEKTEEKKTAESAGAEKKAQDKEPAKDPEKQPEKEAAKEPEKQPEKEADKESEKQPEKEADKDPERQPEKEADKDPEKQPEKETAKEPTREEVREELRESAQEARLRRRRRRLRQQRIYTLVALLVVGAIIAGGYFGGTYVYGRFFGKEEPLRAEPEGQALQAGTVDTSVMSEEELLNYRVDEMISQMSLSDKVSSLFIVTPAQLTGYGALTGATRELTDALTSYPVSGLVLDPENITDRRQLQNMLSGAQRASLYPLFLCVSEPGGESGSAIAAVLGKEITESPYAIGERTDAQAARDAGLAIGTYLTEAGFNLNLAPYASLLTGGTDDRLYGTQPQAVASLTGAFIMGAHEAGCFVCAGVFPVPGAEDPGGSDTTTARSLAELSENEYMPFVAARDAGAEIIMVSNVSASRATGATGTVPCSISEAMITGHSGIF